MEEEWQVNCSSAGPAAALLMLSPPAQPTVSSNLSTPPIRREEEMDEDLTGVVANDEEKMEDADYSSDLEREQQLYFREEAIQPTNGTACGADCGRGELKSNVSSVSMLYQHPGQKQCSQAVRRNAAVSTIIENGSNNNQGANTSTTEIVSTGEKIPKVVENAVHTSPLTVCDITSDKNNLQGVQHSTFDVGRTTNRATYFRNSPPNFGKETNSNQAPLFHERANMQKDRVSYANVVNGKDLSGGGRRNGGVPIPKDIVEQAMAYKDDIVGLDMEEAKGISKEWQFALVGRLFGRRLPFQIVLMEAHKRWGMLSGFKIIDVGFGCFIINFAREEDKNDVWMGGPWSIAGQAVGFDEWVPGFRSSANVVTTTPLWIRLPGLPIEFWGQKTLATIASKVGVPLMIDHYTANRDRGLYARVCVKVNMTKPLQPGVWIDGIAGKHYQYFEYEGVSTLCFECGLVGHTNIHCSSKTKAQAHPTSGSNEKAKKQMQQGGPSSSKEEQLHHNVNQATNSSYVKTCDNSNLPPEISYEREREGHVGPWTIVVSQRRRQGRGERKFGQNGDLNSSRPNPLEAATKGSKHNQSIVYEDHLNPRKANNLYKWQPKHQGIVHGNGTEEITITSSARISGQCFTQRLVTQPSSGQSKHITHENPSMQPNGGGEGITLAGNAGKFQQTPKILTAANSSRDSREGSIQEVVTNPFSDCLEQTTYIKLSTLDKEDEEMVFAATRATDSKQILKEHRATCSQERMESSEGKKETQLMTDELSNSKFKHKKKQKKGNKGKISIIHKEEEHGEDIETLTEVSAHKRRRNDIEDNTLVLAIRRGNPSFHE
ncbi:hypothetical protein AXF42_Ash018854 [Apostasia shenzhenica]|uniref:DUF4283 domain-containing protein n=1 Tax=Apostasia shenzhenica TaxID=1088818 RepID=A0A2I0B4Y6_9ASPA|nr:hypothetical protein AXF42_Ash018854 [Apostasia shenzhenica]